MKKIMALVLLIMFVFLLGCNGGETLINKNYKDFDHIDHWDDFLNIDGEVIAFYYSPFCEICISIQDEATKYLVILEKNYKVVMIHEGFIYEQGEPPLHVIETPSILIYKDHQFSEIISGSKPVLKYLSEKAKS